MTEQEDPHILLKYLLYFPQFGIHQWKKELRCSAMLEEWQIQILVNRKENQSLLWVDSEFSTQLAEEANDWV